MKIRKRQDFEFEAIRKQFPKLRELASHTKAKNLWQIEAAVREKLKALNRLRAHAPKGFDEVFQNYAHLLEELSSAFWTITTAGTIPRSDSRRSSRGNSART
jgi:hypothetical protein